MHEKINHLPFELKELSDLGEFTGIASVFGNKDLGGDVVDRGAFTKTILDRGGKVRLLDGHDVRIGVANVQEVDIGLKANGKINLDKQAGRDAYSDLKFYRDQGLPMGMSIGYETVKAESSSIDNARHLKEVRLWEVSITEFPMNERAQVLAVKTHRLMDRIKSSRIATKEDFNTELAELQLQDAAYQMWIALRSALISIPWNSESNRDEKIAASKTSIQQFMDAYMNFIPEFLDWLDEEYGAAMETMSRKREPQETKEGRRHSAATMKSLKLGHDHVKSLDEIFTALTADEAGDDDEDDDPDQPTTSEEKAAEKTETEPERFHSAADSLIEKIRSLIPAA